MRLFDVAEANRIVPVLRKTFGTVREWLDALQTLSKTLEEPTCSEQVRSETLEERGRLVRSIQSEVAKLEEMGVEVKALEGLVDFRARMNGRTVYLCWKFDEEEITHWHELDSGFAGRQPLREAGVISPAYLS
jgi:hypothetical protein